MKKLLVLFLPLFFGWSIANASKEFEEQTSKRIAWAAANIESTEINSFFRESFHDLLKNKNSLEKLNSPEGQKILQQGKNLLNVIEIKEALDKCLLEQAGAKAVRDAIGSALGSHALNGTPCAELAERLPNTRMFTKVLAAHVQGEVRDGIISIAKNQVDQTRGYWLQEEKKDQFELAVQLTLRERELDAKSAHSGPELLLYTKALKDRKNKNYISKIDLKNAFNEVQSELRENRNYIGKMSVEDPDKALRKLLASNPGAAAQYLMAYPEALSVVCRSLQEIDDKLAHEETLDKVFFWGGMVVAGVLVASGVGAMAGGALATTLTTVAAGAAITGSVTAAGDTIYSTSKAHESYIAAQNIRSSAYAEGLSESSTSRIETAEGKAQSDLIGAGFSAASIIPFGAGFKVMKSAAKSTQALSTTLKEISTDKQVLSVLEKTKAAVPEEELGQFLGLLSDLPPSEKSKVLELVKTNPEKVPQAIREASQSGVCK